MAGGTPSATGEVLSGGAESVQEEAAPSSSFRSTTPAISLRLRSPSAPHPHTPSSESRCPPPGERQRDDRARRVSTCAPSLSAHPPPRSGLERRGGCGAGKDRSARSISGLKGQRTRPAAATPKKSGAATRRPASHLLTGHPSRVPIAAEVRPAATRPHTDLKEREVACISGLVRLDGDRDATLDIPPTSHCF